MSSPSPRASPPSNQSSRSNANTKPKRNRGANAANHNRRGHEFRLSNNGKFSRKKNARRAPRWEREGDALYAEVSKRVTSSGDSSTRLDEHFNVFIDSVEDVHQLLKPWTVDASLALEEQSDSMNQRETEHKQQHNENPPKNNPPFLWGSLPIGPLLSTRLHSTQRSSPTPVQISAFPILTKRKNGIIASPTGTGKTLAYLLPLLCTSPGGRYGEGIGGVLIVTPTIELAVQIQREVDVLWPRDEERGGHSAVFVVGDGSESEELASCINDDDIDISPGRMILRSIPNSPIIAGTPKMLRMLYREADRVSRYAKIDPTILDDELTTAKALLTSMRAIVLDEADRLLRTEAVAREMAERKERKQAAQHSVDDTPSKKKRLIIARDTQTELLLRDLPIPSLNKVQIICASATVGRTMRRQLMQILDAPSADAAATLITGEDDARVKSKDLERRRSVLLPEKLEHTYRVVDIDSIRNVADELDGMSVAEQNEERVIRATVKSLWETMSSLDVAPILIFPGKIGVERIQQELIALGLQDVRTLRNLDGKTLEHSIETIEGDESIENPWKSVPAYVIGERFARGLDLPNVEYVAILSPPSSAAGYAHMAGRTGRSGKRGTAITFVRPKNNEVKRLVAIAETLGVKFNSVSSARIK